MAVAAGIASPGCQPPPVVAPAKVNAMSPRAHPADQMRAARRLPADCLAFFHVDEIAQLFEDVQRDAVARRFADLWEKAVFEIVRETGHNPLSLDGLQALGIDTAGEVGAALLPVGGPDGVIFFTLRAPDLFKTKLYRSLPARRYEPRVVDGVIFVEGSDVTFAIDDDLVMAFLGPGAARNAELFVVAEEAQSLARHRPFRVAMRQLKSTPLLRGWLDLRGLAFGEIGLNPRWGGASYGEALARIEQRAARDLAEARERGASAEELVAIDERYAAAQGQLARGRQADVTRRILGDVEGAGLALDLGPEGFRLRLHVETAPDAILRRVWRNGAGAPRMLGALDRAPLVLMAVGVDTSVARDLLFLVLGSDHAATAVGKLTGGAEIVDLISGDFELALLPRGDQPVAGVEAMRLGATLGLRDAEASRRALDTLAGLAPDVLRRTESGWRLALPDLPPMSLVIASDRLVGASDESLLERLVGGEAGEFRPERALRVVERGGSALTVAVAAGLGILTETRGSARWMAGSAAAAWHDDRVPRSEAYRAKLAELEAMDERLAEQMMALDRERQIELMRLVGVLGHAAASLRTTPTGLDVDLRYQTDQGALVDVIADVLDATRGPRPFSPEQRRLEAVWAQRDAVAAELDAIYERDRARWEASDAGEDGGGEKEGDAK